MARVSKTLTDYFKAHDNQNLRKISASSFDLDGEEIVQVMFVDDEPIEDVSNTAKPLR